MFLKFRLSRVTNQGVGVGNDFEISFLGGNQSGVWGRQSFLPYKLAQKLKYRMASEYFDQKSSLISLESLGKIKPLSMTLETSDDNIFIKFCHVKKCTLIDTSLGRLKANSKG